MLQTRLNIRLLEGYFHAQKRPFAAHCAERERERERTTPSFIWGAINDPPEFLLERRRPQQSPPSAREKRISFPFFREKAALVVPPPPPYTHSGNHAGSLLWTYRQKKGVAPVSPFGTLLLQFIRISGGSSNKRACG